MDDIKTTQTTEDISEVKTEKKKTNAEMLEEVKANIRDMQAEIKAIKDKDDKSDIDKADLKTLQNNLSSLKMDKARLQKKVDTARQNAIIKSEKTKLAERKKEAVVKVLDAEGLNTENAVKSLIALRRVCLEFGVKDNKTLRRCLELVNQNAPEVFES